MRIVFFGSGAFGIPSLERLAREHELLAVTTQPDRPAGRRRTLTPTPVAMWAEAHAPQTPILQPANVNEDEPLERLRRFEADIWIAIAFGQKLSRNLLRDRFAINLHASLLPRWRGAAPIRRAMLAGDTQTGVSVITLADRMDAGDILAQSQRGIDPMTTAGELHDELAHDGASLLMSVLDQRLAGPLTPITQDESLVTAAPKLSRDDAWIDFSQPAPMCQRRVHALTPSPGVAVTMESLRLKLLRVQAVKLNHEEDAGALLDAQRGLIACGSSTALTIIEAQPAGGRPMPWSALARGRTLEKGLLVRSAQTC